MHERAGMSSKNGAELLMSSRWSSVAVFANQSPGSHNGGAGMIG